MPRATEDLGPGITSQHRDLVLYLSTVANNISSSLPVCVYNKIRNELHQRKKVRPLAKRKSKLQPEVVAETTLPYYLHSVDPAWKWALDKQMAPWKRVQAMGEQSESGDQYM